MAKPRSKLPLAPSVGAFNNPFAALGAQVPAASPASESAPASPASAAMQLNLSRQGKVVVRYERKGRGGKTVTLVTGLNLSEAHFAELAREARKALGCGASVEGAEIVLQGDQRERAAAFLRNKGARQVKEG